MLDMEKMKRNAERSVALAKEYLDSGEELSCVHIATDDDTDELVKLIQNDFRYGDRHLLSLDVDGDLEIFVDNVKKYGKKGLSMPC